ncbi:MAG: ABC transporter substrate-binding protein, partial [Planctomycetota bacterium]
MNARLWLLGLLVPFLLAACGEEAVSPRLRLVTTTSTDNSGLLRDLLPDFERREGVEVEVLAVGTGQALALGRRGDADVVLVHARSREDEFVANGHGVDRRDVMWNDFVIVGPSSDPAKVRGHEHATAAFGRIRDSGAPFLSRG